MATDPNQILATAVPQSVASNPFVAQALNGMGGNIQLPSRPGFGFPHGGMNGLLQAAQSADPNAWASFLQQPWAQHLQQRFGVSPDALSGIQQALAGMNTPHDVRQYFQSNYGRPDAGGAAVPPQVGMVPGVPGSMGTNPGAGQGPIMQPGPVAAPQPHPVMTPPQHNPMLPAGFGNFPSFGGPGGAQGFAAGQAAHPLVAGIARPQGTPGFGL